VCVCVCVYLPAGVIYKILQ